jgi:hypothetical protein
MDGDGVLQGLFRSTRISYSLVSGAVCLCTGGLLDVELDCRPRENVKLEDRSLSFPLPISFKHNKILRVEHIASEPRHSDQQTLKGCVFLIRPVFRHLMLAPRPHLSVHKAMEMR